MSCQSTFEGLHFRNHIYIIQIHNSGDKTEKALSLTPDNVIYLIYRCTAVIANRMKLGNLVSENGVSELQGVSTCSTSKPTCIDAMTKGDQE